MLEEQHALVAEPAAELGLARCRIRPHGSGTRPLHRGIEPHHHRIGRSTAKLNRATANLGAGKAEEARRPRPAGLGSQPRKQRGAPPARRTRPPQTRHRARPPWKASLVHDGGVAIWLRRRLQHRTRDGTGALGAREQDVRVERGRIAIEEAHGI
jgi:hypothetical protein